MQAVFGIGQCVLISHFGQAQGLSAHAQACAVHHHKHGRQTLVGLAHHVTHSAIENHLASGVAMDAHFVFKAAAVNAISLAHRTIGLHIELGHHKQADAFAAHRRIGQARQHQVNNVGGQIVFASTDENLLSCDFVAAIGLRFCLGAQHAQVGAAVGFCQAHGAGPFTAGEFGQVGIFLFN